MNNFRNYFNASSAPVVEVSYEMPQMVSAFSADFTINPIITICYADGETKVFDTNLIYKRGYENGVKRTKAKIKAKLGLD